jgi:uncharacterized protein (DUF697 family)
MTPDQKSKCHKIIHSASASAAGVAAGLAQLPLADSAVILPIQIAMVVGLGRVFGIQVTDSAAKGLALGAIGGYVGRATSQIVLGWIPFLGNAVNASTAAGITEALGWAISRKFDQEASSDPKK